MENLKFRTLYADEIEVRVATISEKGASLLLYKDARVDQRLLDETVGVMNWQRHHEIIGGNLYCTVSIYDAHRDEWVEKQDVGTESNTEKEKGQASDSFKRACFNWGIGRELYTAPFIWLDITRAEAYNDGNKWRTNARFKVSKIAYDTANNICDLEIINAKSKAIVYAMQGNAPAPKQKPKTTRKSNDAKPVQMPKAETKPAPAAQPAPTLPTQQEVFDHYAVITEVEVAALTALVARKGIDANTYNGKKFAELTGEEYVKAINELKALKDKE